MTTQTYQHYVNGQWVPSATNETFEVLNPFNGQVVSKVARGKSAEVDKAVQAARKAFDQGPWPRMERTERSRIIRSIADKIEADKATFVRLLIEESGATARKADMEVDLAVRQLRHYAELAKMELKETLQDAIPGGSQNVAVREPVGVCAQIIPWNFPLLMIVWKIGPALATGNTIVLKPAEETPTTALRVAELVAETDLPAGVFNVVTGYGEESGAPLAQHTLVDKVAFTGSTEVGKIIMQLAANDMKRVTLECGGKSANIVLNDADLEQAVDGSLFAIFFHNGQVCTAGSRLFVQDGVYDRFMEKFLERAKAIRVGDPKMNDTAIGPLVSKKQQERVLNYIEIGKKEGANCVLGGGKPTDAALEAGCFVVPTVFTNVTNQMTIAREEIFGPVVAVIRFNTLEEAVSQANDSPYGLAAGIWSQNEAQAMLVASQLRSGTVWINDFHIYSENAPFGGFKQSGLGRELGVESLKAYTEVKHIHKDTLGSRDKKGWYDLVVSSSTPVA